MNYICLRDDDTSFITTPEQLKLCYGEFWGVVPVTLATVPFLHGSSEKINGFGYEVPNAIKVINMRKWQQGATAEEIKLFHTFQPIGDNEELVNELKSQISLGKVEIAQHGVFHRYNECGAEMQKSQMSYEWVRDGKEYLEKIFDVEIKTFIPPANTIDPHCVEYIKRLGMNLFSSADILSTKSERLKSYLNDPKAFIDKVICHFKKQSRPMIRSFGIHKFHSYTYDAFKTEEEILDRINNGLTQCGFVALGTHYSVLLGNEDYRRNYHDLLRRLSDMKDLEFVTANKYYELMCKKYYA